MGRLRSAKAKAEGYLARGHYPALWAHHPKPIKDLIRAIGFRPLIKQCYRNSQLLILGNANLGTGLDLAYWEGWAFSLIPFDHAWVTYKGQTIEMTLDPGTKVGYYPGARYYSPEAIRGALAARGHWAAVGPVAQHKASPWVTGQLPW